MPETLSLETPFWSRSSAFGSPVGPRQELTTVPSSTLLLRSQLGPTFDEEAASHFVRVEPIIGYHGSTGITEAIASAAHAHFPTGRSWAGSASEGLVGTLLEAISTVVFPDPAPIEEARAFGRTPILSIRITPEQKPARLTERHALEDLARWTGLSTEELGSVLGVSRRTIYNWLRGRPVRPQLRARILHAHAVLRPLADAWDGSQVGRWLGAGKPSAASLISQERWDEVGALVREQLRPLRPLEEWEIDADETLGARPYNPEAHRAALQAFCTPPPTPMRRRPKWRPSELTGATPDPENEE